MGTDQQRLKTLHFSAETLALTATAQRAVRLAKRARRSANFWVRVKPDGSLVTQGDKLSQKTNMEGALQLDEASVFLAEESMLDDDPSCHSPQLEARRLTPANYETMFSLGSVHIDDSIDQTIRYAKGLPGWSSSKGLMKQGQPQAGVIVAPEDGGGMLIVSERGKRTMVQHSSGTDFRPAEICPWDGKDKPYVSYADSIVNKPEFEDFWKWFRQNTNCIPVSSCALGIAYVISGKLHAHIHSWAPAYDWFGGWVGILGVQKASMVFHRMEQGLKIFARPDLYSYHPVAYNTGFCCGHKAVVQMIIEQLGTRVVSGGTSARSAGS